jgi:hypothetical protein
MPVFKPDQPIETEEPFVRVETTNLVPGRYRFQLVVIDKLGNLSAPDEVTVTIREGNRIDLPGDGRLRPPDDGFNDG